MENAIKKAVEGGYDLIKAIDWPDGVEGSHEIERIARTLFSEKILLNPLFWQCLGKSQSWTGLTEFNTEAEKLMKFSEYQERYWKTWWHNFIDHLSENKDPEEFFNNLLK